MAGRSPQEQDASERLPPHDLEAERSVLGSILFSPAAMDEVSEILRAKDFYAEANRIIFGAMRRMFDRGVTEVDVVTLAHELGARLPDIGGPAYIAQVMETVPHAAHAAYYARIVRDKAVRRELIDAAKDSICDAYNGVDETGEILERSGERIFKLIDGTEQKKETDINSVLDRTFDGIFSRMETPDGLTGVTTGFVDLNEMTGGLHATELIVLAARPSMGKTALVCNFALAAAADNKPVLFFSLEQSETELAERFLAILARISGHSLRKGQLEKGDEEKLMQSSRDLRALPINIDDVPARTISQIASICRQQHRKRSLGVVIIDYLQLIESEDRQQHREAQISGITRRLKCLAKDLNVPIVVLAQLNRGVEQREEKRPKLSDLRESGAIEQDADIVMFLHRPEVYKKDDRPGEAEIVVQKNRHGPTGTVDVVWIKDQLRFADRARSSKFAFDGGDGQPEF